MALTATATPEQVKIFLKNLLSDPLAEIASGNNTYSVKKIQATYTDYA